MFVVLTADQLNTGLPLPLILPETLGVPTVISVTTFNVPRSVSIDENGEKYEVAFW